MNFLTKQNPVLVNTACAFLIILFALDIAREGYQFGRWLAGL